MKQVISSTKHGKPVIVIGAGGHGRVVAETLILSGRTVLGFLDKRAAILDVAGLSIGVLGTDEYLDEIEINDVDIAIGVGQLPGDTTRSDLFNFVSKKGFHLVTVMHPTATVSPDAIIEIGAQIMAGTVVQSGAVIGANCIINTGALVDHDTVIGENSHIAPGVTICGSVRLGPVTFVGAGATIINNINLGAGAIVPAGKTVIRGD